MNQPDILSQVETASLEAIKNFVDQEKMMDTNISESVK